MAEKTPWACSQICRRHYDTAGYLDLGEKFAEAMNDLLKK